MKGLRGHPGLQGMPGPAVSDTIIKHQRERFEHYNVTQ